jgi:signal transduction histidine kinase
MLRRLRRKFIAIVMVLVGSVLVAVLGSSYVSSWQVQDRLISESLERSLHVGTDVRQVIGAMRRDDGMRMVGMLSLSLELDDTGSVIEQTDAPVSVDEDVLLEVIAHVVDEGELEGRDRSAHIAWSAVQVDDDASVGPLSSDASWVLAIVDTSNSDAGLAQQALLDLKIISVALVVLFAISWWLSGWALAPVEQAWQQQQRFVADASHELKTPLAVIIANTQILAQDESLSDDARGWVQSTSDEATHMKALVQDLLQLARADESAAGIATGAMRSEDIDLSEMVERAALEFDVVAFERGCMLETDVEEGVHLTGDPEWIERLVRILVDNACKYGAAGTEVSIHLARTQGHTQLSVHNWGTPIDAEDLPHIFERFYRSDKARTREGEGGFGLGLAIAQGIAEAHGGQIMASSTESEGTTFRVLF